MAVENLSNISAALSQTFAPEIVRAFNREAVLAKLVPMKSDNGQGDAKQVAWDVSFSGAAAAAFAEGSDVGASEFTQDVDVPAVLSWGQYRAALALSNLEINAASRSIANAIALGKLVTHRLFGSITKLAAVINADLWTGTGTAGNGNPNIIGFTGTAGTWNGALINTGSYGTISTATFTEWQANLLTNGGVPRPLTFALLSQLERNIYTASGRRPLAIVTSPGVCAKYESLFETQKRYNSDEGGAVQRYVGSLQQGMGGMETNLSWRDIPIYRDRNAPTGALLMLDLDNVEGKYLPFQPLSPDGVPVQTMQIPSSNGQTTTPTPLQVNVYPLGRTGSSVKFVAEIYLQLSVRRPNAQGLLGDISEV